MISRFGRTIAAAQVKNKCCCVKVYNFYVKTILNYILPWWTFSSMPACMSQCSTDLPTRCLIMIISSDMQKTINPCKRACVMKFIITFNPFCSHWPVYRCDISTAASTAHVTLSVIHTTTSGKQKHTCAGKGQFCCPVSLQKSVAVSQY